MSLSDLKAQKQIRHLLKRTDDHGWNTGRLGNGAAVALVRRFEHDCSKRILYASAHTLTREDSKYPLAVPSRCEKLHKRNEEMNHG